MKKQIHFVYCAALFVLFAAPAIWAQGPPSAPVPAAKPPARRLARPSAQTTAQTTAKALCAACVQAHEEFLASDAMQGRGSGTHDELVAATYIAAELRAYGIAPAGDDGGYIQRVPLTKSKVTAPPTVEITAADGSARITWTYGKEFLVGHLTQAEFSGPLQKWDAENPPAARKITPGAIVVVRGSGNKVRGAISTVLEGGPLAVLFTSSKNPAAFEAGAKSLPEMSNQLQGTNGGVGNFNFVELNPEAAQTLAKLPDGSQFHLRAPMEEERAFTWNAVGILRGCDAKGRHEAVLLSAHLDHLGIGRAVASDSIYNGADDDASGTTAVLELARVLGNGLRPRRTVIFALFGSEESGGLGSTYFREHPPVPLTEIAANLEFEMIGRADPAVSADAVWLTGWERSNLGPTLAAHGANLVGDPHPDENFFARSDNYVLAQKGVVAQTVSSYGLHKDYHQPSDDLAHLDFKHMDAAIGSMLGPVEWLVNSTFTPTWNKGGKP